MKKRILIVDDDKSILRALTRVLEKYGYAIDSAETANEALDNLRSRHYDLALIDVILPDMKAQNFVKIRELKQTVKFIITGYPSAKMAPMHATRADLFILKSLRWLSSFSHHVFLEEGDLSLNQKRKS